MFPCHVSLPRVGSGASAFNIFPALFHCTRAFIRSLAWAIEKSTQCDDAPRIVLLNITRDRIEFRSFVGTNVRKTDPLRGREKYKDLQ